MTPKRVLIVDDSPTIRQLIRNELAHDPRLVVVGEGIQGRHLTDSLQR